VYSILEYKDSPSVVYQERRNNRSSTKKMRNGVGKEDFLSPELKLYCILFSYSSIDYISSLTNIPWHSDHSVQPICEIKLLQIFVFRSLRNRVMDTWLDTGRIYVNERIYYVYHFQLKAVHISMPYVQFFAHWSYVLAPELLTIEK
jgi:hypothetical protein